MPKVNPDIETFARIVVVGVGGAGGAAVNRMVEAGVGGVEFVAINTDAQALHHSKAQTKVHIGKNTTKGLGAGADPRVGQQAAEESKEEIRKVLEGADMVFVAIGAGGGTGSGAGHIVAEIAREMGILIVGFATKPFTFEGEKRRRNSDAAIENLKKQVDTLITIPNDKLLQTIDERTSLLDSFRIADDVLRQGVQGISDLITVHGLINLDFADVKAIMANAGPALMGIGRATGEDRATRAAQQAVESPLLELSIDGARGILFNVIGGYDMSMHEIHEAAEAITAAADPDANVIFGATVNPELDGEMIVTVVATGFDPSYYRTRGRTANSQIGNVDYDASHEPQPMMATSTPISTENINSLSEKEIDAVDMDLDKTSTAAEDAFHSDGPSMWGEELTTDAPQIGQPIEEAVADTATQEEKFEKPSFLKRLKKLAIEEDDKK